MDPQQTAVYATAHGDLQDLFREIARHGRVSAHELQHALLPFTAGDAKRDLQELIDDMKRRQLSLDEPDFIRVLWKKMYVSNVVYTTQHTACTGEEPTVNIPLAHVIVSIKRRAQLKQFANYYTSRGISGADHLDADKVGSGNANTNKTNANNDSRMPRHVLQAQKKRQAAVQAAAQAATITALRDRTAVGPQDIMVSYYDAEQLRMKTRCILQNIPEATVTTCSRLHCVISSKQTGTLVVGHQHFLNHVRERAARLYGHERQQKNSERQFETTPHSSQRPLVSEISDLVITKLDDLGLRNFTQFGVGRGNVVVTTERRVHCWHAFASRQPSATPEASATPAVSIPHKKGVSPPNHAEVEVPMEMIAFLEDEGDCFGHVPLLQRVKTVSDVSGIRQVACGDGFVMALSGNTDLYTWGTASLGRGKSTPTKLLCLFSMIESPLSSAPSVVVVSRVCCGLHHAVVLTNHGAVFTWGSNVHGQLGLGSHCTVVDADVQEPTQLKLPSHALDVVCGDRHTVALTDKGSVFACGNNWHGQLGLDPRATDTGCVFAPTRVSWWQRASDDSDAAVASPPPPPQAVERAYLITAMGDTTAIVTEKGDVFTWGKCIPSGVFAGACGLVATWLPQRVATLRGVEETARTGDQQHETLVDVGDGGSCVASPWTGIAIASGLVVLTRQSQRTDHALQPVHSLSAKQASSLRKR